MQIHCCPSKKFQASLTFKLCVLITISTWYIVQPFDCLVVVTDEDKDWAKLLTGYQDMVGFLHVHKVAQTYSQVPKYFATAAN